MGTASARTWAGRGVVAALALGAGLATAAALGSTGGPSGGPGGGPAAVEAEAPAEPPAVPVVLASPTGRSGEVRVRWDGPGPDDGREVDRWVVTSDDTRVEVDGSDRTALLTGLADGEASSVVVTAVGPGGTEASIPTPVTSRSIGDCTGATITWDGGAATTAWGTAANWDADRVPDATDDVCIPAATDVVVASSPRPSVASVASAGQLTLPAGIELLDTTTSSLISDTEWPAGTLTGRITVVPGATLRTTGTSSKAVEAQLDVQGTVELAGTGTTVACRVGQPSGVDVTGSVDVTIDGEVLRSTSGSTCTPTVQVRHGATFVKTAGSSAANVRPAVVVAGTLASDSGQVFLRGGTAHTDWTGDTTGPTSGTSDGAATGTIGGPGLGTLNLAPVSSTTPTTYHLAGATLDGRTDMSALTELAGTGLLTSEGKLYVLTDSTLSAELEGGAVSVSGGTLAADVLAGTRVWTGGTVRGDVEIRSGAYLRAYGSSAKRIEARVLVNGRLRFETATTTLVCQPGQPSGLEVTNLLELGADGDVLQASGSSSCTPTVVVRPGATMKKYVGTGTSTVLPAVVNEGLVVATVGTLDLRGGSVHTNWTGATSGPGSGTATGPATGEYRGTSPGAVALRGTADTGSTTTRTYNLGTTAKLAGQVRLGATAALNGTTATVLAGGTLTVNGTLAVDLDGGTIRLDGGLLRADVLPGQERVWTGGTVGVSGDPIEIMATAELRITGAVTVASALTNHGSVEIDGGSLGIGCSSAHPIGFDNAMTVSIRGDGAALSGIGSSCTPRVVNRATGTIVKASGTGTSTINLSIQSTGTISASSGVLSLRAGTRYLDPASTWHTSELEGAIRGDGGIVELYSDIYPVDPDIALSGSVRLASGGTMTGTEVDLSGGRLEVLGPSGLSGVLDVAVSDGTVFVDGGVLSADTVSDVDLELRFGWLASDIEVDEDAVVTVTGQFEMGRYLIVNRGSIVVTGGLRSDCVTGSVTGVSNFGELDVRSGYVGGGKEPTCSGVLWNHAGGTLRKSDAALDPSVQVSWPVVNRGLIEAEAGVLQMREGTVYRDTAGLLVVDAAEGTIRGSGASGVVEVYGDAFVVGPDALLEGHLRVAAGTLGGTGLLDDEAVLDVTGSGRLDALLTGGTIRVLGGTLAADLLPGVERELRTGSLAEDIEVDQYAEVRVTGQFEMGPRLIVNRGLIVLMGGLRSDCVTGSVTGVSNFGTIELRSGYMGGGKEATCSGVLWNRVGGIVQKTDASLDPSVQVSWPVVNRGLIEASAGEVMLREGTVYRDAAGALVIDSAAGTIRGSGTGVVLVYGDVFVVGPDALLEGHLRVDAGSFAGVGELDEHAVLDVTGSGQLDALLGGGTIRLLGGRLAADLLPGVDRELRTGSLAEDIEVDEHAEVRVTGVFEQYQWLLVNRGLITVEMGGLRSTCATGTTSGIDNHGTIDLVAGWIGGNPTPTCSPMLWNRDDGVVEKTDAAFPHSDVSLPVVNHGTILATHGELWLRDGGEQRTATGALVAEASTGEFRGAGGVVVFVDGTFELAHDVTLDGDLRLVGTGMLRGVTATLEEDARLLIDGGTLAIELDGGIIEMQSGHIVADILPGQSRVLAGGQLHEIEIVEDAVVELDGEVSTANLTTLTISGTLIWPSDVSYIACILCTVRIEETGVLEVRRVDETFGPQFATVTKGILHNEGLVKVTGDFPGVIFTISPTVPVTSWGKIQLDIDQPSYLTSFEQSDEARAIASTATAGDGLGSIARDVWAYYDDHEVVVGVCGSGGGSIGFYSLSASVCTVTDSDGGDAVAITLAAGMSLAATSEGPWDVNVAGGVMFADRLFNEDDLDYDDLDGLSICLAAEGTYKMVSGQLTHCVSPPTEPFSMNPLDLDLLSGVHATYANLTFSPHAVEARVSLSATYTITIPCDTWSNLVDGECPIPPEVRSVSTSSGHVGDELTVNGVRFGSASWVTFTQGEQECSVDKDDFVSGPTDEEEIVVVVPESCGIEGETIVSVTTPRGGESFPRRGRSEVTFTILPP